MEQQSGMQAMPNSPPTPPVIQVWWRGASWHGGLPGEANIVPTTRI